MYDEVTELLTVLTEYLRTAAYQGTAAMVMFVAGEALAYQEHMLRAAGRVHLWQPPVIRAMAATLELYQELMAAGERRGAGSVATL